MQVNLGLMHTTHTHAVPNARNERNEMLPVLNQSMCNKRGYRRHAFQQQSKLAKEFSSMFFSFSYCPPREMATRAGEEEKKIGKKGNEKK